MAALRGSGLLADELVRPLTAYIRRQGSTASAASTSVPKAGPPAAQAPAGAAAAGDDDDWRFKLVRSIGEECQTDAELRTLLKQKQEFILYDGFEPSGRMHIAQGIFKSLNVNKCTKAGGIFIFWVADWFALMNDKMGGDLEKIKTVGKYFIEVWKASGMDMSRVRFHWAADDITNHAQDYWMQALDIARKCTLARIKKCCQIMGRKEDCLTAAQIMYPIMQSTDIFFLKADICQLGVDQRKVNMLARDYCSDSGRKNKPVILSHHMLYGLAAGQAKMSKSNPDSAVFMEDTPADVERKIRNAYCPTEPEATAVAAVADEDMQVEKDDLMNPCLDYVRYILFSQEGFVFKAGGKSYATHEEVKAAFLSGEISEAALKDQIITEVNRLLDPVRNHFATDPEAKALLAQITQWKKETLVAPSGVVRLTPKPALGKDIFAVFAPLPTDGIRVDEVLGLIQRLQQAPKKSTCVLWLEDWNAFTLGCVGGTPGCIRAFYDLLLFGLRKLAPELMKQVRVCWQGEMIVSGASEYWISVINAGRRSTIDQIRESLAQGQNLEYSSQVFAALMHIGDVLALSNASSVTLCCDAQHANAHRLAAKQCKDLGVTVPDVKVVESPALRLMQPGEGMEADVNVFLTDTEIDVNKKVKKAFCEPENVKFCPPIAWVAELVRWSGEFKVTRKPDNGGDRAYTKVEDMQKEFGAGELHPGDLKPAFSKGLNAFLEPLREDLKSQDALKKAVKDLAAQAKAQSKKK